MRRSKDKQSKHGTKGGDQPAPKLAPWKLVVLILSILLTIAGGAGYVYAVMADDDDAATAGAGELDPALAAGLLPGVTPEDTGETDPSAMRQWSPVFFRLGFSFFAGFCIAFALRSVIKIAIVVIGLILLAIVGLQATSMLQVDWSGLGGIFDGIAAWVGSQTGSFQEFLTGYLPSSASGLAGLAVGFRGR